MSDSDQKEYEELPALVKELWDDVKSGPLTNKAAREIERLGVELQKTVDLTNNAAREIERLNVKLQKYVDEHNEAWFKIEELEDANAKRNIPHG